MPAYGVSPEEVAALRKAVDAGDEDAVVFVADKLENAKDALLAVVERAKEAIEGVPAETRTAKPDGSTRYMRPRPGAARMYPETDIPPALITDALIEKVNSSLPEATEKKLARFMKEYSLNEKLAKQVIDSEYSDLFEVAVKESGISATTVAAFLTETVKSLKRDGVQIENVSDEEVLGIFKSIGSGSLAKEAVADVFVWLSKHEDKRLCDAMKDLKLRMLSKAEIEELVDRAISTNKQSVDKLGKNAFGMLMGAVMKDVRGKADPDLVSKLLRERLN
jgi:glutamyl-tRNA(Gln) amidotransferase subunit E